MFFDFGLKLVVVLSHFNPSKTDAFDFGQNFLLWFEIDDFTLLWEAKASNFGGLLRHFDVTLWEDN